MRSWRFCPMHLAAGAAVAAGLLFLPISAWAQTPLVITCDLNADSSVNIVDVQLAVNRALGTCTADVIAAGQCNSPGLYSPREVTAALTNTCPAVAHYVTLNWTKSTSSNVGYNIYRKLSTDANFPTAPLNSASLITGTTYIDVTVVAGQKYIYQATAKDLSSGSESVPTSPTSVVTVPTP